MAFHKVHCPRCGRTMYADELAFDLGEVINIALEKAKNRTFAADDEWYDLTKLRLCLYLTLRDLINDYNFKMTADGSYEEVFEFTTEHLGAQLLKLADSLNPNYSLAQLVTSTNQFEYNKLTKALAPSGDIDFEDFAEKIQELAVRIQRNPNVTIARFHVTVRMQKDDRGEYFANQLLVKFDDGDIKTITRFVCKGEKGQPCGKVLYGHAGRYKEIVVGLAGTARVGKTAYLASLLACILKKSNGVEHLGYSQDVVTSIAYQDESFEIFEQDLLDPYIQCKKIAKTPTIFDKVGDTEAISLFSLTFAVKNPTGKKKYIFTFIDMPGEVFDDGNSGANDVLNNRQIITSADMIWMCISPAQIEGGELVAGADQVNTNLGVAFRNLNHTMAAISQQVKIPAAVLITCSDLIPQHYGLFHDKFNPFESNERKLRTLQRNEDGKVNDPAGKTLPWINSNGELYYTNMLWYVNSTYNYLNSKENNTPESIANIFGSFTPFAIASYGKTIDNPLTMGTNTIPSPSMVEAPFLWTLAVLGMIPAYKEVPVDYTKTVREGFLGLKTREVTYTVWENHLVKPDEIEKKLFRHQVGE